MPETERAIWAALEIGRPMTLDDLQIVTGVEFPDAISYLSVLMRERYVTMPGGRTAASGEAVPLFQLIKRTGPEAPYLRPSASSADSIFVDPNLPPAKPPRGTPRDDRSRSMIEPTLTSCMRLAAEWMGRPFTMSELREAVRSRGPSKKPWAQSSWPARRGFKKAWANMCRQRAAILETARPHKWNYVRTPLLEQVRDYLRGTAGTTLTAADIAADLAIAKISGPTILAALDMLLAEGFRIEIGRTRGVAHRSTYRVERGQGDTGADVFVKTPSPDPSPKTSKRCSAGPGMHPMCRHTIKAADDPQAEQEFLPEGHGESGFLQKAGSPDLTRIRIRGAVMSADVRTLVNKFLHKTGRGGVTWLAREAGVSKTAVSQFRHGNYPGTVKRIQAKLRAVLDRTVIMDRVSTGELRPAWLVNSPDGLRLVKRRTALDAILERQPQAHVITVWVGRDLSDVHFTEDAA